LLVAWNVKSKEYSEEREKKEDRYVRSFANKILKFFNKQRERKDVKKQRKDVKKNKANSLRTYFGKELHRSVSSNRWCWF